MGLRTALRDIVLPAACSGCGRLGPCVCPRCHQLMTSPPFAADALPAVSCGALWASCLYEGTARRCVIALKHDSTRDLRPYARQWGASAGKHMGPLFAGALEYGRLAIVAAPSSSKRRRQGKEVVPALADGLACGLAGCLPPRIPLACMDPLRVSARCAGQSQRTWHERMNGRKNTIECRLDLSGYDIVIVDDVVTTGATAAECARSIRQCAPRGVNIVATVCLCVAAPYPTANKAPIM